MSPYRNDGNGKEGRKTTHDGKYCEKTHTGELKRTIESDEKNVTTRYPFQDSHSKITNGSFGD